MIWCNLLNSHCGLINDLMKHSRLYPVKNIGISGKKIQKEHLTLVPLNKLNLHIH